MSQTIGFHCSHEWYSPRELLDLTTMAYQSGFTAFSCSDHISPWTKSGQSGYAWSWLGAAMERVPYSFGTVCAPSIGTHLKIVTCSGRRPTIVDTTRKMLVDSNIPRLVPPATPMTPPPPNNLQVGDRIRILRVPEADLRQRDDELARGAEMAGHTANTIDCVIAMNPIVKFWQIDEFGYPWYEVTLIADNGESEQHTLMVYDDETWKNSGE